MDNQELKDLTLICKDCGEEFIFYAQPKYEGDEFNLQSFLNNGFEQLPLRCQDCRTKRKESHKLDQSQNKRMR